MNLSNPLAEPLFVPVIRIISTLLLAGLVAIFAAVKRQKQSLTESSLFIRWKTWVVLAPLAILSILSGPPALALVVGATAAICTWELATMAKLSKTQTLVSQAATLAIMIGNAFYPAALVPILVASLFALAIVTMLQSVDGSGFEQLSFSLCSTIYVGLLSSFAISIALLPQGKALLIATLTASAVANVMAFTAGKTFGGAKLAAALSPNKTWSGACGAIVGAATTFGIIAFCTNIYDPTLSVLFGMTIAIAGIAGDLCESMAKRSFAVKDAGTWLPGFGGALDRVDGLLFVLPSVYFLSLLCAR
jgi:phosphatidate cytidylyltransferase